MRGIAEVMLHFKDGINKDRMSFEELRQYYERLCEEEPRQDPRNSALFPNSASARRDLPALSQPNLDDSLFRYFGCIIPLPIKCSEPRPVIGLVVISGIG